MTEAELIAAVRTLVLGAEACIPLADFISAYEKHRPEGVSAFRFAALAVQYGDDAAAMNPALAEARQHKFFNAVWTTLLERIDFSQQPEAVQKAAEAITAAVASGRFQGTMQRVRNDGGFGSVRLFPLLERAASATGLLKVKPAAGGIEVGTGFLVSSDLVLTAAHVIQSQVDDAGAPRPDSADRILVEFHNLPDDAPPVKCRVAARWLEVMSPPLGAFPALENASSPGADNRLDFALIRLADPVGARLGFLDMRSPPEAVAPSWLAIIGYPGGSDCQWDKHQLLLIDAGARIRHGVNAIPGMSGSPCLGSEGGVVALHEGAVDAPPPAYNRAVSLRSIRAAIRQRAPDPLESETTPFGIQDADAVRAWVAAATTRLGGDAAGLAEWLDELPTAGNATHPVFGRDLWLSFIREAMGPDAVRRVALITGQRWSGKSFSLSILRAALRTTPFQFVRLPPETLRDELAIVLAKLAVDTDTAAPAPPPGVDLRPATGLARRDLIPSVLKALKSKVMARPEGARQIWVALDFGSPAQLATELLDDWKEWVRAASEHQWLRTVVIGLRETGQKEFAAALPAGSAYLENIAPITNQEFQACLEGILRQVAPRVPVAEAQENIDALWNEIEMLNPSDGRSLEAVRAALRFRRVVRSA